MPSPDARGRLRARLAELDDLGRVGGLLGWDQQTMMPPGGGPARGEAMATLERIAHERATDPDLGGLLDELGDGDALLRVARRDYDRARRVPTELAGEMALAASEAQPAWVQARERSDFQIFAPFLERNIELRRRYAECFPESEHPYDALLDRFEPDATAAQVSEVFDRLRAGLVPLIAEIAAAGQPAELEGELDVDRQRVLSVEMVRAIGYDDESWRLDPSVHPFASSIARTDIRVTTRYAPDSLSGVFATLHEVGHGLYEHAIDPELDRTTLGTGVSMGIHESQSRMWENCVGRGLPWWRHWYPRAQELFPEALGELALGDFHKAINAVEPSLIRVEADEATYSLHVVLRFELELRLIEGSLAVADLPEAWNAGMKELLGVDVPDDRHGVLQDIHWAFGELGYFPTYALGNVYGAQLWDAARAAIPDLDGRLAVADCAPLRDWLRENVHRHGRALMPAEIIERATGGALDPQPFLNYLEEKYRPLYSL